MAIPAPPATTKDPVVVEVVSSVELCVNLPVAAPTDNVVAAPKALMVVALVLNTLKVALLVVMLVKKSGDVAPEVINVPAVGNVTFEAAVVVNVRLKAPDVASVEPLASVKVALVAGAVIAILL